MLDRDKHFRRAWNTGVAGIIDNLDSPAFEGYLINALRTLVAADGAVIFIYRDRKKPEAKFIDCLRGYKESIVDKYIDGYFALDPFYISCSSGTGAGLYTLAQLAPSRFRYGEYYKVYYGESGISDEVCFILPACDDCRGVISLTRMHPKGKFKKEEIARLAETVPVVNAFTLRAWKARPEPSAGLPPERNQLSNIRWQFESFMSHVLSPRERQVAAMILRGYSSAAIGAELAIAEATVKANRRNIYAKLGISSQAELLALFIRQLQSDGDPASPISTARSLPVN